MKKILLPLVFLGSFFGYSQITVDDTSLTVEQLINDVLISGSCTAATDITSPNNSSDSGETFNSFGFFDRATSNFPFDSGLVMSTGDIVGIPTGPIISGSNPPWDGDNELDLISGGATNNATEIVFDFVPIVPTLTFNYVIASEEYETGSSFPCTFADVFAFILTGPGIDNVNDYDHDANPATPDLTLDLGGKNIALLPGTNIPAALTNIHDEGPCPAGSLGEFAFPEFYDSAGSGMGDTAFGGRTVSLTAEQAVVPGQTYTIKLVVADFADSIFNTAVFIEAGSFDIGSVDLGVDLTVPSGNARCEGDPYTIVPDLDAPPMTTFEWFYEDPLGSGTFVQFMPPETNPTLTISTTGNYQLIADLGGVCSADGDVFVEFAAPFMVNPNPSPLVLCDDENNDGFADFTLSDADMDITGGDPDLTVSYHGTFINADLDQFELPDPYENDQPYNDVPVTDPMDPAFGTGGVWARVESMMSSCYEVVPLTLEVRDIPEPTIPAGPLRICDDEVADGFTFFNLTLVEPEVLTGMDPTMFDVNYYETEALAIAAGDSALVPPADYSLAIPDPTNFLNSGNPQTIYILVVGNDTSTSPNNGTNGCYAIVPLDLVVDPLPEDFGPFELRKCDDEVNGSSPTDTFSTFDLTQIDDAATNSNPLHTVSWYETPADEMMDNPISDFTMYQNTATPQTIIGRVTTEFDCTNTFTLDLIVLPNPTANMNPTPLELCDNGVDPDDGLAEGFVLTDRDAEIIAGQLDVNVLYYFSEADAIAAVAGTELPTPYTTVVVDQIVYARVTNDVPPNELECYTIVELPLNVIALPDMPDATSFQDPYFFCDETGDGNGIFDLTVQDASVLGVQDPTEFVAPITYYTSLVDAEMGMNEINPANAFPSAGQTVWVRLESLVTGCIRITPFELVVGTFPVIGIGDDQYLCDDEINDSTPFDGLSTFNLDANTETIQNGDETLEVFYYANAANQTANLPIINPEAYQNEVSPQQEILVSVFNGEGCVASNSFFINVEPNPNALTTADPLVGCDIDNDGFFTEFMLEDKDVEISNGEVDVDVSYYLTPADAEAGDPDDMLSSPYTNIVQDEQTIYVRVTRQTPPGVNPCYTVVSLLLKVESQPNDPNPETFQNPLQICDEDDDGIAVFDLTLNTAPVLETQEIPSDFLPVTYYEDATDADLGVNAIDAAETLAYTNISNPQSIWVRAENGETGCYLVTMFELRVDPLPVLADGPFEMFECDDEQNGSSSTDEISTFDLTINNSIITNSNSSYSVSYYVDEASQDANTPIADPTNYQNLDSDGNSDNPKDIFVTVFTEFGCEARTRVTLEVLANPTPSTPEPLQVCDGDGDPTIDVDNRDGLSVFDLSSKDEEIIGSEPGVNIMYYESFELAEAGDVTTAITTPMAYENMIPNSQLVYARVEKDVPPSREACFTIVELELIVNPLPDDTALITDLVSCEFSNDGVAIFDLTEKATEILNGQDATAYTIYYYRSVADAQGDNNRILDPENFPNESNPDPIYLRIVDVDPDRGCYVASMEIPPADPTDPVEYTLSFNLEVKESAMATPPALPYVICDNLEANDGIGAFTLFSSGTDLDDEADALAAEILNGQDPSIYILTYHETIENAEAGTDPLGNVYTNVINPQVIYARVTNEVDPEDEDACYAVVEVQLSVEQLPIVLLPETYRLCTDGGVAIPSEEGESSPPVIDTELDPVLYLFEWSINGVSILNETGPSIIALEGGSYEVTITELESGCSTIAATTVTVSSPPQEFDVDVTSGAFDASHTIEATVTLGEGQYVFQLDDGVFQDQGVFTGVSPGDHTVTIRDENGCGSVTVEVGVIDYPRLLTPNEDGFNDDWNIIGIASGDPTAKIYIFDRFGKLLKQISPQGPGWDGTYNGNPLPSSDYWFRVEYKEDETSKEFTGHFTLKR